MTIAQATDLIMNGYKALPVSLTATPIKPMGKNPRMGLVLDQCKGGIIKIKSFVPIFSSDWNVFAKQTDGSIQWIPEQLVGLGEDFHSQVDNGNVKTTLYKVRWRAYDSKGDTDKTVENTLKVGINTKSPTRNDKGVFTDMV